MIAVVGEGGDAGDGGHGGDGGGINVKGEDNTGGNNAGLGGVVIAAGELPANGIYGSLTTNVAYAEDSNATNVDGGRVIKCTKGIYWRDQGISACEDVTSNNKFRLSDGTEVQNTSSSITRGFKAGYNMIETKGDQNSGGGQGGTGAFGGGGGINDGGGGGGSGYTDGSVTVVSTQQGGSTGAAKVVIRLAS